VDKLEMGAIVNPMKITTQELSALTLMASGVPPEKVEKLQPEPLGPDAVLVKKYLLDGSLPVGNDGDKAAEEMAKGIREWFSRQLAESEQWRPSEKAPPRIDYDQLMSE
jgi:hypothetical protein